MASPLSLTMENVKVQAQAHIHGKAIVSGRPDYTATAASVVSEAIGENLFDGSPLPNKNAGKDPQAIERGRQGGLKGGEARAVKTYRKTSQTDR
jgi:hypothetical protein